MKYDVIIKDLTAQEFAELNAKLLGTSAVVESAPSVAIEPAEIESDGTGVDAEGFAWDARIHSSNKKKTAKGVWTKRKGVDDATEAAVKAELRGQSAPTFNAPPVPVLNSAPPVSVPPAAVPVFTPAPPVAAPVAIPALAPASARDFNGMLMRIQNGFATGKVTQDAILQVVNSLNTHFGTAMGAITDVNGNAQLTEGAHSIFDQMGL
jgi:hypothetical protein